MVIKRETVEWIKDVPSALRRINREIVILENLREKKIFRRDDIIVNENIRKYYSIIARLFEILSRRENNAHTPKKTHLNRKKRLKK